MSTLKTSIILFALLISVRVAFSQSPDIEPTGTGYPSGNDYHKDIQSLKGRTLLVIIDDKESPEYSKAMRDGFTKYWVLTKVSFIKASELKDYLGSDQYAIFSFLVYDMFIAPSMSGGMTQSHSGNWQSHEAAGSNDLNKILDADSIPPLVNDKHENIKDRSTDSYFFQFILCGKFAALKKNKIENLPVADYEEVYFRHPTVRTDGTKMSDNIQFDYTRPVKYYQAKVIPYIIPYIIRFQNEMSPAIAGKFMTPIKEGKIDLRDTKFTIVRSGKEYKHVVTVQTSFFPGALEQIKGKKIYIDSALSNGKALKLFARTLNTDTTNIIAVDRQKISEAFQNKDPNVLELDYNMLGGMYNAPVAYVLYSTEGEMLANVGSEAFWYLKFFPDYDINLVPDKK